MKCSYIVYVIGSDDGNVALSSFSQCLKIMKLDEMRDSGNWYCVAYRMRDGGVWRDSYDYEDYTFYNPVTDEVQYETGYYTSWSSEMDKGFPKPTQEVWDAYYRHCVNDYKANILKRYNEYSELAKNLNELKGVQEKGQIVEVVGKGKHHGKVGKVSWMGKSKYNTHYEGDSVRAKAWLAIAEFHNNPFTYGTRDIDLVRVFPTDGSAPFYVAKDACMVVEGFKPYECTLEWVKGFYKNHHNDAAKMHGTWNESGSYATHDALDEALATVSLVA